MWLRTLASLSFALCVWQLTEARPPSIPPRHHQLNRVQSHGGSSFMQKARSLYSQRHLQNKLIYKENPPPREFSSIVHQRRINNIPKRQSNLQKQSPRASPLIARQRHIQTNTVSQNTPSLGDVIKSVISGSLDGRINNDRKNQSPVNPSPTSARANVEIEITLAQPVTLSPERNQASGSASTITSGSFSGKKNPIDSEPNLEKRTIILASPDYTESNIQPLVIPDSSFPEHNQNSGFQDYSTTFEAVKSAPASEIPANIIPESGFPKSDFSPDFPDYSDVVATSPVVPNLHFPDSQFPEPDFPPGFPDYSNTNTQIHNSQGGQGSNDFILPDSGFPEPDFPPGFPDYSDAFAPDLNNQQGKGSNDFILPDSGFPEPDFPPGFPDYSDALAPTSSNQQGQGSSDFILPDSGFPEPDFPPGFPDYSDSIAPTSSHLPGEGSKDFILPDSGFPEPNFPPDFPDYSSSFDNFNGNTKSIASSSNSNFNSPDYNAPSIDYNGPTQDFNTPPQTSGTSGNSSPDYPQASSPNQDYPSLDYNLDNPNNAAQAKTIRTQQDLFDLVKVSLLEQLSKGGGRSAPKSISATPGHQNIPVNNRGPENPLEHILSFGQNVFDDASGTGRDFIGGTGRQIVGTAQNVFGTGRQIVGVAQETIATTVDAVSKVVDDVSREVLRSIQLVGGELQFIANDALQGTLQKFNKLSQVATSVGGDFYRATLQVNDMLGRFISSFMENVGRFVGTAINRTVDGALQQAVSTGQFIADLKGEFIRSVVDNGNGAQQLVQRALEDTGNFVSGMGGITTRLTASATRSITGATLK